MLAVLAVASALTLQGRGEMDGVKARRVLEASRAADAWVFDQVHTRLAPDLSIVTSRGRRRAELEAFQESCRRDLTNAAYEQICDAYGVTKKQFNAIVRNPERVLSFQYTPEKRVRRLMRRQLSTWEAMGTRFDPKCVRLKEGLAKRYGYINPRKPEPAPEPEPSLTLEQLIGPSPLPKRFTEPKADEARAGDARPNRRHGAPVDHEKEREEFAKGAGVTDYRIPGSPLD